MTECERIIEKGVLPEKFFDEEVRCDFLVTKERKKLWAVELDLLIEFDRVCKKHKLRYFLNGGTLLGAIRHKGFIPWDDDIDVEMPREDYEKIMMVADEFVNPYFLQTPRTDSNSAYTFAKLRNSNTTMCPEMFAFQEMNHGVCIDIFPYDKWDINDSLSYYAIRFLAAENSTFMRLSNPKLNQGNLLRARTWTGVNHLVVYDTIEKIAQRYNNVDSDFVIIAQSAMFEYKNKLLNANDYQTSISMEFESLELPVPIGYQNILMTYYGDYMQFPPIEKRGKWHSNVLIDVDTPYKEFLLNYRKEILCKQ